MPRSISKSPLYQHEATKSGVYRRKVPHPYSARSFLPREETHNEEWPEGRVGKCWVEEYTEEVDRVRHSGSLGLEGIVVGTAAVASAAGGIVVVDLG